MWILLCRGFFFGKTVCVMKIVCVGYRKWALRIYKKLEESYSHDFLIINSKENFDSKRIIEFEPDLILFYGWSWKISNRLIQNYKCIMLHPSPLPKYRGGSPIQNQIINGEVQSKVTLFIMDDGMDTGPLIAQQDISFEGSLDAIFKRITKIGYSLTKNILDNEINPVVQNNDRATIFKRRHPEDSEVTINETEDESLVYIYNKIRMLDGENYPKSFIDYGDIRIEFSSSSKKIDHIEANVKIFKLPK